MRLLRSWKVGVGVALVAAALVVLLVLSLIPHADVSVLESGGSMSITAPPSTKSATVVAVDLPSLPPLPIVCHDNSESLSLDNTALEYVFYKTSGKNAVYDAEGVPLILSEEVVLERLTPTGWEQECALSEIVSEKVSDFKYRVTRYYNGSSYASYKVVYDVASASSVKSTLVLESHETCDYRFRWLVENTRAGDYSIGVSELSFDGGLTLDWSDALTTLGDITTASVEGSTASVVFDVGTVENDEVFVVDPEVVISVTDLTYGASLRGPYGRGGFRASGTFFQFYTDGTDLVYTASADDGTTWMQAGDDVYTNDPSSESGSWADPVNAYDSDDDYAYIGSAKPSASHVYGTYGYTALTGPISKVRVAVRGQCEPGGNEKIQVRVTWDGGGSWADWQEWQMADVGWTMYWFDFTGATSWTPTKLNNTNFQVEIRAYTVGGGKECWVAWLPAEVTEGLPIVRGNLASEEYNLHFDGTYVHIAYCTGAFQSPLYYRRGTPLASGIIEWTAQQTVLTPPANEAYYVPTINVDSTDNPVIGTFRLVSGSNYKYPTVFRSDNTDGTWSTSSGFPYELDSTDTTASTVVVIIPLNSGRFFGVWCRNGQVIRTKLYDGSSWSAEYDASTSGVYQWYTFSGVGVGDDAHITFLDSVAPPKNVIHVRGYGVATEKESYDTGDDSAQTAYGTSKIAQTFTPGSDVDLTHGLDIGEIQLKLYEDGTATGDLTVEVYVVDGNHYPTGGVLTSGVIDSTTVTASSPGSWYSITFDSCAHLTEGTEYALVFDPPGAWSDGNSLFWRWDQDDDGYTDGTALSYNGVDWSVTAGDNDDYMFRTYEGPGWCPDNETILTADAGIASYPTLTKNASSGHLYCVWKRTNSVSYPHFIYYKEWVDETDGNGDVIGWDSSKTTWLRGQERQWNSNSQGNEDQAIYGDYWKSQSVTSENDWDVLKTCKVRLERGAGSATVDINVDIYDADGEGKPTGPSLASTTVDSFTGGYRDVTATFSPAWVLDGIFQFCVVVSVPTGTASEYYNWWVDQSSPSYPGGNWAYSDNGGSSWTADTGRDGCFLMLFYSVTVSDYSNQAYYEVMDGCLVLAYTGGSTDDYVLWHACLDLSTDVTNEPGGVDFGMVAESSETPISTSYFEIDNVGTVAINVTIGGTDMTGDGKTWTLSDTATPGSEIYGMKASVGDTSSYDIIVKKTAAFYALFTNLATSAVPPTTNWSLKFYAPTTITSGDQLSGTITLTATEYT